MDKYIDLYLDISEKEKIRPWPGQGSKWSPTIFLK